MSIQSKTKHILLRTPPVSTNHMYRGRRFLTKEGKQAKYTMGLEIASQVNFEPHKGIIALNVIFYFQDNRRRDIDGFLKATLDAMTGIVYEDDSQITELHVFKEIDKQNPRTEITIV